MNYKSFAEFFSLINPFFDALIFPISIILGVKSITVMSLFGYFCKIDKDISPVPPATSSIFEVLYFVYYTKVK